jgi:hypothetical protein
MELEGSYHPPLFSDRILLPCETVYRRGARTRQGISAPGKVIVYLLISPYRAGGITRSENSYRSGSWRDLSPTAMCRVRAQARGLQRAPRRESQD